MHTIPRTKDPVTRAIWAEVKATYPNGWMSLNEFITRYVPADQQKAELRAYRGKSLTANYARMTLLVNIMVGMSTMDLIEFADKIKKGR